MLEIKPNFFKAKRLKNGELINFIGIKGDKGDKGDKGADGKDGATYDDTQIRAEVSEVKADLTELQDIVMVDSYNLITDTFTGKDINTWSSISSLNLNNYTYDSANFNVYQIKVESGKNYSFYQREADGTLAVLQAPNLMLFDVDGATLERKTNLYNIDIATNGFLAISVYKSKVVAIADHNVTGEEYLPHKKVPRTLADKEEVDELAVAVVDINNRVTAIEEADTEAIIPNLIKTKIIGKGINNWSAISSLNINNITYDNANFNVYIAEVSTVGRHFFYRNENGEALDVSVPNITTFNHDGNAIERFASKTFVDVDENVGYVAIDYNKNYDLMVVSGGYVGKFMAIGEYLKLINRHYNTFSVIGDSYSSFAGYMKDSRAGSWYPADSSSPNNDVKNVEETWWYLFGNKYGSALMANNSWTGSTISYDGYGTGLDDGKDASFIMRADNLEQPELVFIFGGTNDEWVSNDTGRTDFLGDYKYSNFVESDFVYFRPSLAKVIDTIKHKNIGAKIVFILNDALVKINESVEVICNHYGVDLIKLNNISKGNSHPTIEGMKAIASEVEYYLRVH